MDHEHFGQAAMELSPNRLAVHVTSINDLPREVMELIFEELDSITLKKIERVGKRWMHIIRGAKKFRTHLKFEPPSHVFPDAHSPSDFDYCDDLISKLVHLVKPDLEVLHFKPSKLPIGDLDNADFYQNIETINLHALRLGFQRAGVDLTKVDIVISDCTVDCTIPTGPERASHTRKIRILRSNIMASDRSGPLTLYVEELWLEPWGKVTEQIGKLFSAENGPLTKAHSDALREFRKRLIVNGEPNIGLVRGYASYIVKFKRQYMDEDSWIEAMMTIANGGHVPKYTADFLKRESPALL